MIKNLQSLRFFFIMLVVASHIIGVSFGFGGDCGVSFFFVLSGFVLSLAYGQKIGDGHFHLKSFLKRQLLKFYPLHIITFLIMLALDARLGRYYDLVKIMANVLLLQSWVPNNDFFFAANGSSWFLSDLFFFYLLFPWLFLQFNNIPIRKLGYMLAIVVTLYICLAVVIPSEMVTPVLYVSPLTRVLDFSLGILLFRFCASPYGQQVETWLRNKSSAFITCIEGGLILWVVISFFIYEMSPYGFGCASLFWGVSPLFMFVYIMVEKFKGLVSTFLHHPFLLWLGSISFEIYLTHLVTLRILYGLLSIYGLPTEDSQHILVVTFTIIIILVVSYLVKFYFVDKIYGALKKYV